jgi:hypothetical protein
MKKELTQDAVERYVRTAGHCPFCDSERIQAGAAERDDSCTLLTQDVECLDCGREWREVCRVVDLEWAGDDEWEAYPPADDDRPDVGNLLAAAPDLLQAARCALADLEGFVFGTDADLEGDEPVALTMKELRAAIAKAEGSVCHDAE